jgi:hypothetical protein
VFFCSWLLLRHFSGNIRKAGNIDARIDVAIRAIVVSPAITAVSEIAKLIQKPGQPRDLFFQQRVFLAQPLNGNEIGSRFFYS